MLYSLQSVLINITIFTFCPAHILNFNKRQTFFNSPILQLEQSIIPYHSDLTFWHMQTSSVSSIFFCQSRQMPSALFRGGTIQVSKISFLYISTAHECFNFLRGSTQNCRQHSSIELILSKWLLSPCSIALQFSQSLIHMAPSTALPCREICTPAPEFLLHVLVETQKLKCQAHNQKWNTFEMQHLPKPLFNLM